MPIYMTAKLEVKKEALEICKETIQEFVDYVRDENARDIHSNSDAVNHFTSVLYPNLLAPVEFTEYAVFVSTQ
jgi:hypothetical protein